MLALCVRFGDNFEIIESIFMMLFLFQVKMRSSYEKLSQLEFNIDSSTMAWADFVSTLKDIAVVTDQLIACYPNWPNVDQVADMMTNCHTAIEYNMMRSQCYDEMRVQGDLERYAQMFSEEPYSELIQLAKACSEFDNTGNITLLYSLAYRNTLMALEVVHIYSHTSPRARRAIVNMERELGIPRINHQRLPIPPVSVMAQVFIENFEIENEE